MPTGLTLWVEFKCLPVARVFEGEPWGFSAQPGSLSVLCPNRACKVTSCLSGLWPFLPTMVSLNYKPK